MTNTDHPYKIRTITEDGNLISDDADFAEKARLDWFSEVVRQAEPGEIVQLINIDDNRIESEVRIAK